MAEARRVEGAGRVRSSHSSGASSGSLDPVDPVVAAFCDGLDSEPRPLDATGMAGFQFHETMSGTYALAAAPDRQRAISFTVGVRVYDLGRFARDRMAEIQGAVEMEGFASHRPLRGTLEMDPILGRRLVYDFEFEDDAGASHRFVGRKSVSFLRLLETMTTLPAEIFDGAGRRIADATLRFDVRSDLVRFLSSFRPLRVPA